MSEGHRTIDDERTTLEGRNVPRLFGALDRLPGSGPVRSRSFEALAVEALRELDDDRAKMREELDAKDARIAELEARVERLESIEDEVQALKDALLDR